jgi:capsular polysaccharide biosynthesis protein
MYRGREYQICDPATISVLKCAEKSKNWKSIAVLIVSFAILGIISAAQLSFGIMEPTDSHITNIVLNSFSEISRSDQTGNNQTGNNPTGNNPTG